MGCGCKKGNSQPIPPKPQSQIKLQEVQTPPVIQTPTQPQSQSTQSGQ